MARRRSNTARSKSRSGGPASSAGTAEIGPRGKWTVTGAARTARDARIATVRHVRTAEVAQRWEMTKLVTAWDTWCRHLRDQAKGMGHRLDDKALRPIASQLLYGGSGLLAPWPDTFDDAARRILDRRADDLETATLYVLSPSMCDVAPQRRHSPSTTWR